MASPEPDGPLIACSLNGPQQGERARDFKVLCDAALVRRSRDEGVLELRFRPDHGVQASLESFIELESQCCAFLDLSLRAHSTELVLRIAAPDGARPVLDAFDLLSRLAQPPALPA